MTSHSITRDQWVAQIAEASGHEVSDVDRLLAKNGIAPRLTKPIPRRLLISEISFSGEKTGDYETKEIRFFATDLKPGLHAVVSEASFKGKTTLFKIIRWLLTGTYDLPADMSGWLRAACLKFKIDSQEYELAVTEVAEMKGTLSSIARGKPRVVAEFSGPESFNLVMDNFFLDELGLEPLLAVADKGEAVEQRHGWNWLFTVMIIDTAPDVLFGTDTSHGKPLRMMQMYLGIPWVLTRADLMAARKRGEIDANQAGKVSRELVAATERRLSELRASRSNYAAKAEKAKSASDLKRRALETQDAYMGAAARVQKLTPIVGAAKDEFDAAEEAVSETVRELMKFKESQAAGKVFRKLRPVSCPSCEEAYTAEYRELKESNHDCVVCGRHEVKEGDPPAGIEEALVAAVWEAKAGKTKRRQHYVAAKLKLDTAIGERDRHDKTFRKLQDEIAKLPVDSDADTEIIRIDAQITELERMVGERAEAGTSTDSEIWDAAIEVTKKLYDDEQSDVLRTVSGIITTFAQSFGMTDLVSVNLKGNTNMDVVTKGGRKTFSKCTAGERMRLKTAATLALIQVSEQRGIGIHPGILFVDSVGNNEITDTDVAEIVDGLAKLHEALPEMQVFVAGIASDAILAHVPCGNVIKNRPDGYLW